MFTVDFLCAAVLIYGYVPTHGYYRRCGVFLHQPNPSPSVLLQALICCYNTLSRQCFSTFSCVIARERKECVRSCIPDKIGKLLLRYRLHGYRLLHVRLIDSKTDSITTGLLIVPRLVWLLGDKATNQYQN